MKVCRKEEHVISGHYILTWRIHSTGRGQGILEDELREGGET